MVIEAAARLLRERGFEGTGVADIMEAAGLTHGGFYRNFTSKDDLATLATGRAASTMKAALIDGLAQLPDEPFRALVEHYMSHNHRENPGSGCILPALAADAARSDSPALRAIFTAVVQDYLDQLTALASTMPEGLGKRHPGAILSEMVGAVILSRVVANDEMANLLLDAVVTDIAGAPKRPAG
ncbi:TetR/AcrR family transcriptional regulator [Rhizobium leguminosarum]|uniref:TetR/AcrR family transcriptional regulator n=1 Tax=Rhizobium leguminosarum TaxID=384 RepID=UPI003F943CC1